MNSCNKCGVLFEDIDGVTYKHIVLILNTTVMRK